EAVIRDEESAEEPLDRKIVKGLHRGATRIALDHMEIGETSTRQCRGDPVKQALWIAVGDVVLAVLRRDAQTRTHGANGSSHRVDDLEQEPHTVLDAASISVGALVGAVAQKLVDQISVRAMHLDAVEAGRKRVPRSLRMLRDDAGDLRCLKRAWRRDRFEAVRRECSCVRPNSGWGNRQGTGGLKGGMGDAPDMPELEHHAAATSMDRISHAFPTCDLLDGVDTWRADIALALGRDLGCFRDDEPGAGPLGVIQGTQRSRHIAGAGAASSQGRHDNAVRQRERSYLDGGEEFLRAICGQVLHGAILLMYEAILLMYEDARSRQLSCLVAPSRWRSDAIRARIESNDWPAPCSHRAMAMGWAPLRPPCIRWRRRLSEINRGKPQFRFVRAPEAIQSCEAHNLSTRTFVQPDGTRVSLGSWLCENAKAGSLTDLSCSA